MTNLLRIHTGRTLCALACITALALVAPSSWAADPVGEWALKMDMSGRTVEGTVAIAKGDDGGLTGTWTGRRGENALKDVAYADGKLTFLRPVSYQGQDFELAFEGAIENDILTGIFTTPMGDFEATGPRVVLASASSDGLSNLVGKWKWISDSQLGVIESTFVVQDDGSATLERDGAAAEITNLKLDGNALTFEVSIEAEGAAYDLTFAGTVDGGDITGEFSIEDIGAVADVTGTKEGGGFAILAGNWDWVSDSQLGVIESKFIVQLDGSAVLENPDSEPAEVRDLTIDGNDIAFKVTVELEGNALALEFEGTVTGDALEGVFLIEDIGTVADVTATRGGASGLAAMVGSWEVTSESQLGTLEHTVVITADGGLTFAAADTVYEATNVVVEGNKLAFDVVLELEGTELPLEFEGTIEGSDFEGEFFAEGASVAELSGGRAGTGLASLEGSWKISADTPLGTLDHTMTLKSDGTGVYLSGGESSDVNDLVLDGSAVGFSVTVYADGAEYEVSFEGKVDGSDLLGTFFLDGADVGVVTGKKEAA